MKTLFPPLMRLALKISLSLTLVASVTYSVRADTPSSTQIANISSRVLCETQDAVTVTEFAVRGPGTEYFILRALGPSLAQFGVPGVLKNPTLTLLDARGRVIDFNDNWVDSPDKDAIIATGIPPTDDRESAIVQTLSRGIYTSVVRGVHNGTGIDLSEVYRLSSSDEATLITSIGTRGFVSTGDNVLISGFIVTGTDPFPMLIRVLGPSLTSAGIPGALADPVLELHNANGDIIASNDNWRDTQEAEIIATGLPPENDLESALVVALSPGAYTVVVRGLGDTEGIGFVQYYSLDIRGQALGPQLNPAPIIRRL